MSYKNIIHTMVEYHIASNRGWMLGTDYAFP